MNLGFSGTPKLPTLIVRQNVDCNLVLIDTRSRPMRGYELVTKLQGHGGKSQSSTETCHSLARGLSVEFVPFDLKGKFLISELKLSRFTTVYFLL